MSPIHQHCHLVLHHNGKSTVSCRARCRLHRESLPTHALNILVNIFRVDSPGIQVIPRLGILRATLLRFVPSGLVRRAVLLPVVCRVSCGRRSAINLTPIWDLLRRHACCYPRIRALHPAFTVFGQPQTYTLNALIAGCPLLITPGQCARFVDEELEYLTDLQAVKPPSEQHHRLHLSLWSVS